MLPWKLMIGGGGGVLARATSLAAPPVRAMSRVKTRMRAPRYFWQTKHTSKDNEALTDDNESFVRELVQRQSAEEAAALPCSAVPSQQQQSDSAEKTYYSDADWQPGTIRCGLIAKKIGVVPMWLASGKYITSTMLHVSDNHVVKSLSPEELNRSPAIQYRFKKRFKNWAAVVVGADQADPRKFTKQYSQLFAAAGMLPTQRMTKFIVSPHVQLPCGVRLRATHFDCGDIIDICGRTIERGFQGVVKRWGFKGMPASHGTCKTHRRPGCIGGGGAKARVWPGQKMPGHMGGHVRTSRGNKILRINTEHDVIYVQGSNVPGDVGDYVLLHDTVLPLRKRTAAPKLWTDEQLDALTEDLFLDGVHNMALPSINFTSSS